MLEKYFLECDLVNITVMCAVFTGNCYLLSRNLVLNASVTNLSIQSNNIFPHYRTIYFTNHHASGCWSLIQILVSILRNVYIICMLSHQYYFSTLAYNTIPDFRSHNSISYYNHRKQVIWSEIYINVLILMFKVVS